MKSTIKISPLLLALLLAGCVNVDPDTGKTIPRENNA